MPFEAMVDPLKRGTGGAGTGGAAEPQLQGSEAWYLPAGSGYVQGLLVARSGPWMSRSGKASGDWRAAAALWLLLGCTSPGFCDKKSVLSTCSRLQLDFSKSPVERSQTPWIPPQEEQPPEPEEAIMLGGDSPPRRMASSVSE